MAIIIKPLMLRNAVRYPYRILFAKFGAPPPISPTPRKGIKTPTLNAMRRIKLAVVPVPNAMFANKTRKNGTPHGSINEKSMPKANNPMNVEPCLLSSR